MVSMVEDQTPDPDDPRAMPTYVYLCEANGAAVEVIHGMAEGLQTWGELCERAGRDPGDTPTDAPVRRQIFAAAVHSAMGPSHLKNLGFGLS